MLLFEQVRLSLLVLSTQQPIVVLLLLLEQSAACWSSLLSGWIESGIEADKLLVLGYGRRRLLSLLLLRPNKGWGDQTVVDLLQVNAWLAIWGHLRWCCSSDYALRVSEAPRLGDVLHSHP